MRSINVTIMTFHDFLVSVKFHFSLTITKKKKKKLELFLDLKMSNLFFY